MRLAHWTVVGALGAALLAAPAAPAHATPKFRSIGGWPFACHGLAPATGKGKLRRRPARLKACRLQSGLAPQDPAQSASGFQPAFGLNEDWAAHLGNLGVLPQLGAQTSRIAVQWAAIEPSKGHFDWSAYDPIFAAMSAHGISPMITVDSAPCWAHPKTPCASPGGRPPDKQHLPAFARFVGKVVRRYPNLAGVEVWNEPNLSLFWYPHAQPAVYAQMLRLTSQAVNRVSPRVPVLFAGMVPQYSPAPGRMDARAFERGVFKAGGGRWIDAIGMHPYVYPHNSPDLLVGVRAQLAIAKGIAGHFGYPTMPLWVTEFGLSSSPDQGLGPDGQASRLVDEDETLRAIPGVPVLILHRLYDTDPAVDGYQADMGLIDLTGNRKPAFCALAQARGVPCPAP